MDDAANDLFNSQQVTINRRAKAWPYARLAPRQLQFSGFYIEE
jgi:hypothetical protein